MAEQQAKKIISQLTVVDKICKPGVSEDILKEIYNEIQKLGYKDIQLVGNCFQKSQEIEPIQPETKHEPIQLIKETKQTPEIQSSRKTNETKRKRVNLTIDPQLYNYIKAKGLSLSALLEEAILRYAQQEGTTLQIQQRTHKYRKIEEAGIPFDLI
jgi:post-segregation antitoxin (ccd killing protein)/RNA-binding protein YhbY